MNVGTCSGFGLAIVLAQDVCGSGSGRGLCTCSRPEKVPLGRPSEAVATAGREVVIVTTDVFE